PGGRRSRPAGCAPATPASASASPSTAKEPGTGSTPAGRVRRWSSRGGAEHLVVGVGLPGRVGVVGGADVEPVDRVHPAFGVADLMATERGPDVREFVTIPVGGGLQ